VLVTLRRRGQSIRIGNGIEITVLEIHRTKVRLGIQAPEDVRIIRSEVVLIEKENAAASRPPAAVDAALRQRLQAAAAPHGSYSDRACR
jgi:carbon storage regulator